METERTKPIAVFMAFGTKGDVYPLAAIAAGFAHDQKQYHVVFITHSAHEEWIGPSPCETATTIEMNQEHWSPHQKSDNSLSSHLAEKNIAFLPISSPPVSIHDVQDSTASMELLSLKKTMLAREHRQACYAAIEKTFGEGPSKDGDLIVINYFALEGWSLAELFCICCIVAAPYVVPYSAPSSFERHFRNELPHLYKYLQEAPPNKVSWKDVNHWMWPLFTEYWGSWRRDLNLSPCPFTDPVTGLPTWHDRPSSPLLLYGFSKEVVECPDYWPSTTRVCGFWFLPIKWQFSCKKCGAISELVSATCLYEKGKLCLVHVPLQSFLEISTLAPPVFIGLNSVGSMGFLKDPAAFLHVLQSVLQITNYRFIIFTAGFEPLDAAIRTIAAEASSSTKHRLSTEDCVSLFDDRLFCFSGTISYNWLFTRCAAAVHHGGSGTTAAALHAGIPQVLCPFMHDQFYWAERMFWLGVATEPLKRTHLFPESSDDRSIQEAANVFARAIHDALSPKVKARAAEICERLSLEDGVLEAVRSIKEFKLKSSGDDKGWTFGVQDWPNFYKFEAGDILVFKYEKGSHNVAQLDKFGYDKCRVVESSAIFSSGNDHITLEKGLNYFICGIPGHCSSGLKISVSAS